MKTRVFSLLLCTSLCMSAQRVPKLNKGTRALKTAKKLQINFTKIDSTNLVVQEKLALLLNFERRHKREKNIAKIFKITGFTLMGVGGLIRLTSSDKKGLGEEFGRIVGTSTFVLGVVSFGVSIPIHYSAKTKAKERDRFIESLYE